MSPERLRGEPSHEQESAPYYQAVRFQAEEAARRAYQVAQETIHDPRNQCDLSTYRIVFHQVWHVAIVGARPSEDVDSQLRAVLADGEPTELPADVLAFLLRRREQARRLGPWVERHYGRR